MKRWVLHIFDWVKTIGIALVVAVLINTFVLQSYVVRGESMLPTLENEERLFVIKAMASYDYGDIVIVDSRTNRNRTIMDDIKDHALFQRLTRKEIEYIWIKRIIGLEGDEIEIRNGTLFRNGEKIEEPYIKEEMFEHEQSAFIIPEGHFFVMGDNRNYSDDSRVVGPIPPDHIIGKMLFQ